MTYENVNILTVCSLVSQTTIALQFSAARCQQCKAAQLQQSKLSHLKAFPAHHDEDTHAKNNMKGHHLTWKMEQSIYCPLIVNTLTIIQAQDRRAAFVQSFLQSDDAFVVCKAVASAVKCLVTTRTKEQKDGD